VDPDDLQRLERSAGLATAATEYADVPAAIEARVRAICGALPEVTSNPAWAGTQWRVRKRTFAHVLAVDFAAGPLTVVTFRSAGAELTALRDAGLPYFRPAWGADAVGLVADGWAVDGGTDWDEVGELLTDSYRVVAPLKLVARLP
jgi:hypothetical protein